MTDLRRKNELTVLTSLRISKLVGVFCFLRILNYTQIIFFYHGYLDFYGFEVKSNARVQGSRFSFDRKRRHHNINDDMTYDVNHVLPRCWK